MPVIKEHQQQDRAIGEKYELEFCNLMQKLGCFTHRFQKGYPSSAVIEREKERINLPDIWVVLDKKRIFDLDLLFVFVEVKGKYPTKVGESYGLEEYRVNIFKRFQEIIKTQVVYAVFDTVDKIWRWNLIDELMNDVKTFRGDSYVGNEVKKVNICYFPKSKFIKIGDSIKG